jgi:hypothetical protein
MASSSQHGRTHDVAPPRRATLRVSLVLGLGLVSACNCNKEQVAAATSTMEAATALRARGPLALVPAAGTTIVGGLDLAGLQRTPSWQENKAMVEAQGKERLAAMAACDLGLDKWKSVTFGLDPVEGEDELVVVIVAEGIGRPETLACASNELQRQNGGKAPWVAQGTTLALAEGGEAHGIDADTLVVASKAWAAQVQQVIRGEAKSVQDGPLAAVIARADATKHVWLAGTLPKDSKRVTEWVGAVGEPVDMAVWLDMSGGGVEIAASVGFASSEAATKAKQVTEAQFEALEAMASRLGVPQAAIDSVRFEASGSTATVTARISQDDLRRLQATVKARGSAP